MKRFFLIFTLVFGLLFVLHTNIKANEGETELRSTSDQEYRCYVYSQKMQDQNYRLLVSCRDLIYPGGETVFTYVLWANPLEGGSPNKLGELGFGKAEFKTKEAFIGLFVTTEENSRTKSPDGLVVMRGTLQSISFLDRPQSPTPTPEGAETEVSEEELAEEVSTGSRILTALRRAGIVIILVLAAVMGLVFVLTRPKT